MHLGSIFTTPDDREMTILPQRHFQHSGSCRRGERCQHFSGGGWWSSVRNLVVVDSNGASSWGGGWQAILGWLTSSETRVSLSRRQSTSDAVPEPTETNQEPVPSTSLNTSNTVGEEPATDGTSTTTAPPATDTTTSMILTDTYTTYTTSIPPSTTRSPPASVSDSSSLTTSETTSMATTATTSSTTFSSWTSRPNSPPALPTPPTITTAQPTISGDAPPPAPSTSSLTTMTSQALPSTDAGTTSAPPPATETTDTTPETTTTSAPPPVTETQTGDIPPDATTTTTFAPPPVTETTSDTTTTMPPATVTDEVTLIPPPPSSATSLPPSSLPLISLPFATVTSTPISYTPVSSMLGQSDVSTSTTASTSFPFTLTSTMVYTTTLAGGVTTTMTTVIETGVLSTDVPRENGFARNTGAIIGVAVAAAFGLLLIGLVLFFFCKRLRSRRRLFSGSSEDMLSASRRGPWRPPLGGDEESFMEYRDASTPDLSATHEPGHGGSSESPVHGSLESTSRGTPALAPVFGPTYIPTVQVPVSTPSSYPTVYTQSSDEARPIWRSVNLQQDGFEPTPVPLPPVHLAETRSRSDASLTLAGGSSSGEHGASSSSHHMQRFNAKRTSHLDGPLSSDQRPSSLYPTSYFALGGSPQSPESQDMEQPERQGVRDLFNRLRGRRASAQSVVPTTKPRQGSNESLVHVVDPESGIAATYATFSPSLLNPPMTIVSHSPTMASFPHSNGFLPVTDRRVSDTPWRPATSPISDTPSSPVLTDSSSMVEGLLHPRLGLALALSARASTMSLRDHEDYSRPISGQIFNRVRSTGTYDGQSITTEGDRY